MARPAKETLTFEIPREDLQTAQQQQIVEETDEDFSVQNLLAELGSGSDDAKVNVYLIEAGKPNAFVDSFAPGDFSLEGLKQTYGAGTYHIQVRVNGRIATRRVVRIAKGLNMPVMTQLNPNVLDQSKLIETMQSGFKEMGAMFAQALGQLAANQPKPKTTLESLQELQLMREILGGNQQQPTDPLGVLNLAKELSTLINPPPNDENTMMMEGLKMFAPLLQNQLNGPAQPAPSAGMHAPNVPVLMNPSGPVLMNPPSQTTAPITAGPVANLQVQQESPEMFITLYLKGLVANAKADKDPLPYAHVILDMAGENVVREMIASPAWFEEIVKRVPEAAQHQPWFEELKAIMVEILQELTNDRESGNSSANPLPDSNNASGPDSA